MGLTLAEDDFLTAQFGRLVILAFAGGSNVLVVGADGIPAWQEKNQAYERAKRRVLLGRY